MPCELVSELECHGGSNSCYAYLSSLTQATGERYLKIYAACITLLFSAFRSVNDQRVQQASTTHFSP